MFSGPMAHAHRGARRRTFFVRHIMFALPRVSVVVRARIRGAGYRLGSDHSQH